MSSAGKVKNIRKWNPSINMADVIGWGLTRETREVMYWDMVRQPSCPDPAIQNWLLVGGGRVVRIDANQQPQFVFPEGPHYLEFLRLSVCVGQGVKWKQVFAEDGTLVHVTKDGRLRFTGGKVQQRPGPQQV